MISHRHVRLSSFRWLLAWAVVLCFGAGGTAFGQGGDCPPPPGPLPVAGLGAGPGNAEPTFGYSSGSLGTGLADLMRNIGIQGTIPAEPFPGVIRAIAVQRLGANTNKFIIGGRFTYRIPGTTAVYHNIMRLNANGSVDTTFPVTTLFGLGNVPAPPVSPLSDSQGVFAIAVDSLDRIIVGGEFANRLLRLLPTGALDAAFTPPATTATVLALEVDPANNIYVGLNGGTIGGRLNFTRLLPTTGAPDPGAFWNPGAVVPPAFPTSINGPVRAIKYAANLFGIGVPGVVVGGTFTQATGGTSQNVGNVALYDLSGQVDFFFPTTGGGANDTVNALAVAEPPPGSSSQIFAGGAFSQFNQAARTRVAKFTSFGLDLVFNPPSASSVPNPVRALAFTNGVPPFTSPPPFSALHVGGRQPSPASGFFADVVLSPVTGALSLGLQTRSSFPEPELAANVFAIAANGSTGALFGGFNLNANAEKLVATFTSLYNPPSGNGLPSFLRAPAITVGPTQFYASVLDDNEDQGRPARNLYIAGDVALEERDGLGNVRFDRKRAVALFRFDPCGRVSVIARFQNLDNYLVRNDNDNGVFEPLGDDINRAPGQGFRRVDSVPQPVIRALAFARGPNGEPWLYVGGLFNRVIDASGAEVPWNNLVRLRLGTNTASIDPLFQVGTDDQTTPQGLGYANIRRGGPTGFGAPGTGFSTVDPETVLPSLTGTCDSPPLLPPPGTGRKYDPAQGQVNAIEVQPDRKVIIGGAFKAYNEVPRGGIARLTETGSLDQTFGDSSFSVPGVGDYLLCGNPGGSASASLSRSNPAVSYQRARVNDILLEPDGKVIVAGLFAQANNVDRYNIARFNSDGTLDTSFSEGPTGTVFPSGTSGLPDPAPTGPNRGPTSNGRGGEIFALGRQALGANAGRILIGGEFTRILNPTGAGGGLARRAFTRFETQGVTAGRHDASFAQLNFTAAPVVRAIAVQSDDRPLIGGPFLIGPRNFGPGDGIGYINNTTRPRIHRTGVNGTFTDDTDPFGVPRSTWMTVPPGTGQNPNAPLVFQPGPYANGANPTNPPGGITPVLGSPASVFAPGSGVEISYYNPPIGLPFNTTPPFGARFVDTRMTVNTITLDPVRRRAYIGGLFNTFESVRTDFQNDSAAAPNGLNLDIRWPAVTALKAGCTYGLVRTSFPPFQPIPAGDTVDLGSMPATGGQMVVASMTRSAVSLCNLMPTISTTSGFVTIVGAVPRATNPGFVDIVIELASNGTGVTRNGSVTVTLPSETGTAPAPVTFNFSQPAASGCNFAAAAFPNAFPIAGGTGQFQITANPGCNWTITDLPSWITASATSGTGSATVNFSVAATTGGNRSATVTVAGQPITITQSGCTYTVAATPSSFPRAGGSGQLQITTGAGCPWSIGGLPSWITVGVAAGTGSTTVNFTVANNPTEPRTATLSVAGQTVTITQAGCAYTATASQTSFPMAGGTGQFTITATLDECPWVITNLPSWITTNVTSGNGNATVNFTVAGNTGGARNATVMVAGQMITITQAACTYTATASATTFPAGGSTGQFVITTASTCPWTITGLPTWVTAQTTSGSGNANVTFVVDPNTTGVTRTATVTVAGQAITLTQAACAFTATASPTSFPRDGGTGQFTIATSAGCPWAITGLPAWITSGVAAGTGSTTVNFTVAANDTGASRSATVTVAGQPITITQMGCTFTLTPPAATTFGSGPGSGSFGVTITGMCGAVTATSSAPWLTVAGGPTSFTFNVARNNGAARQATITVSVAGSTPPTRTITINQLADIADTIGMFRPSDGFFYLRFTNTPGFADTSFFYGLAADIPLTGDWNGNGTTTIGVFRNGQFLLRNSNTAGVADIPAFSITGTQPGDVPVAGDWDGDGVTTVGLFRSGVFLLRNSNTTGAPDLIINYGLAGDVAVVGDWDGDGVDSVGCFRPTIGFFFLRNTNTSGPADISLFFGQSGDTPIAGDWDGDGIDTIGVFRGATFFLRNSNTSGVADLSINYGNPADRPVVGKWQGGVRNP